MREGIISQYQSSPLRVIIIAALFIRLLAAFFSEGYAFHDDHFCVTRVAQHWSEGIPHWIKAENPPKHSMIYAGANAAFMWIMDQLSVEDPIVKTTILRIIHAFYSLLVITLAYKITLALSDRRNANLVGWLLAFLWFMPFLSVKFLAELVCVPPVLAAFHLILKDRDNSIYKTSNYWWSGLMLGVAFAIRMHTILFAGALGLVMLFDKKWKESIIFTIGYLVAVVILIGIPDIVFFDYPFQYVVNYFGYNSANAYNYISGSPFKFFITTVGFLVPPISLFLIWGFTRHGFKISAQIFLAVLIFFVFHSAFPNQQERFILPIYPLLIIIGVIGWNKYKDRSAFWIKYRGFYKGIWISFWTINIIAAMGLALTFSKKDRVAPLHYIYEQGDATSVILEGKSLKQVPAYYMGENTYDYVEFYKGLFGVDTTSTEWANDPGVKFIFSLHRDKTVEDLRSEMSKLSKNPNYVVFKGSEEMEVRKERIISLFPNGKLVHKKTVYPSNYDRLLHFLNPRIHKNSDSYIYKIED